MQTLLQIRTSLFSDRGESSRLAQRFVGAWRAGNPLGRTPSVISRATPCGEIDGTPRDTKTQYMRNVLGFLGMSCVEFVDAEGLAIASAIRDQRLAKAHEHIGRLASPAMVTAWRVPR